MTTSKATALPVLYEDAELRILDKPSGISVLKDNTGMRSVADLYSLVFGEPPLFVHRLDKGTSGVLALARMESARSALSRSFSKGEVMKTYLALVSGVPRNPSGWIELPLEKARKGKFRVAVPGEGLPALTEFRLVAADQDRSLLEIHPRSGRTHQIRVHLQAIGHPLCVDPLYGPQRGKPSMKPGLTLHAWRMRLPHPISGKVLLVEAPAPSWTVPFMEQWKTSESAGFTCI